MVAPAGCILHATSSTGTGGRATSAQAQALCRDAPPKLWIVARAHALLHCSTLLVAHIKSEFAKCTFAEVSQTRPLQASAASACTDRRAHTAYLCVCVDVSEEASASMHTHVQPCYRPTMLGSMGLTPNETIASLHRCTLCRVWRKAERHIPCLRYPSRRRQRRR